LHVEVVELDWLIGEETEKKAEYIIMSQTAPKKLSESAAYQQCAWCDMKGICHQNVPIEKNCRSCSFAQPVEDGQWHCNKHEAIIPREFIPNACPEYNPIA
jgi:hypothetical protein